MFFRKVRRLGLCSSTRVCGVSEYLSLADSKLFKSIESPSHCLSHILPLEKNLSGLRSRGPMATSFPYVSIVFVKTLSFPDAYFICFVIVNFSVQYNTIQYKICKAPCCRGRMTRFWCFSFFCFLFCLFSTFAFVICCFTDKEISFPVANARGLRAV